MILLALSLTSKHTPTAWMISATVPKILFPSLVTSNERYGVISGKRRSTHDLDELLRAVGLKVAA
jgi:hypothetical protein